MDNKLASSDKAVLSGEAVELTVLSPDHNSSPSPIAATHAAPAALIPGSLAFLLTGTVVFISVFVNPEFDAVFFLLGLAPYLFAIDPLLRYSVSHVAKRAGWEIETPDFWNSIESALRQIVAVATIAGYLLMNLAEMDFGNWRYLFALGSVSLNAFFNMKTISDVVSEFKATNPDDLKKSLQIRSIAIFLLIGIPAAFLSLGGSLPALISIVDAAKITGTPYHWMAFHNPLLYLIDALALVLPATYKLLKDMFTKPRELLSDLGQLKTLPCQQIMLRTVASIIALLSALAYWYVSSLTIPNILSRPEIDAVTQAPKYIVDATEKAGVSALMPSLLLNVGSFIFGAKVAYPGVILLAEQLNKALRCEMPVKDRAVYSVAAVLSVLSVLPIIFMGKDLPLLFTACAALNVALINISAVPAEVERAFSGFFSTARLMPAVAARPQERLPVMARDSFNLR